MIGFAKAGFAALGIPPEKQPQDPKFQQPTGRYRKGVRDDPPYGGYRDSREWHLEADSIYRGEIHAIVIIASHDKAYINEDHWHPDRCPNQVRPLGPIRAEEILTTEYGHQLWRRFNNGLAEEKPVVGRQPGDDYVPVEWFGFRDGLSNPRFFDYDPQRRPPGADGRAWDPFAPLSLVLTDDRPHGSYQGSYMAYWKLEQRVEEFLEAGGIDYFARELFDLKAGVPVPAQRREDALGLIVGRRRDGTPMANPSLTADNNDFDYASDPDGLQCPFHAHVRRTNPRGEVNPRSRVGPADDLRLADPSKRGWLIARRGMPYSAKNGDEKGLLFMSFQATLENFELIVQSADNEDFVQTDASRAKSDQQRVGMDPIMGNPPQAYPKMQSWPRPGAEPVKHGIYDYVWFKGGEYFYVPSLAEIAGLHASSRLHAEVQEKLKAQR
jgi:Dyp-type peroxidase family